MSAPEASIIIDQGSEFALVLHDRDQNDQPINYASGFVLRAAIKQRRESAEFVYNLSPLSNPAHGTLTNGSDPEMGNIQILIPAGVTAAFPVMNEGFFWVSVEPTDNAQARQTIVLGRVKVRKGGLE